MKARSTRGIALINALIIVASISAISIALLARTERAMQHVALSHEAAQADRYLEAAEALLRIVLDRHDAELVHLGQGWARPREGEPIDRGSVDWTIHDLQGRFNVNRMIGDEEAAIRARDAFFRLAVAQEVSEDRARMLVEAFSPVEARRDAVFGGVAGKSLAPPLPLRNLRELGLIAGVGTADIARLSRVATALPGETALNVNTAVPEVVSAVLPGLNASFLSALELRQANDPFLDVEDFLEWGRGFPGNGAADLASQMDLSVGSEWFEAEIEATLGSVSRTRSLVLHRPTVEKRTLVVFSLAEIRR